MKLEQEFFYTAAKLDVESMTIDQLKEFCITLLDSHRVQFEMLLDMYKSQALMIRMEIMNDE